MAERPTIEVPEPMRVCPSCSARYEAPAQYCQRDGVPLRIEQEARDPYLGQKIVGQFRLEKIIGSGGMGVVYSAWDEGLGRRVAVKILHRDLVTNRDVVARFHREAQIAHQLDHPNIVRLILFGQLPDGNLYLVLEYLEGPTLLAALDRDGAMPAARAVRVCSAVSDAIGYAHRRDIVHRDLKPENIILVNRDGDHDHPKVLDFGIAKMLIGGDTLVTQAGLIFGTARYISPEGAQGDPVDKRSDVYSLAVITYQMLAGTTPFDSAEPVQLLLKHIHDTPPALRSFPAARNVPPAVEAVVMRALAKSPAARYGDGSAYARALRDALAESDPQSAIKSVIPTASMPMYVGSMGNVAPMAVPAAAVQSPVFPANARPAENGSGVRPHPVAPGPYGTMLGGSPAAAIQPSHGPIADPVSPSHPSSGPYLAVNGALHAAALHAVEPVRIAPTVPVAAYVPQSAIETGPHPPLRAPSGIQYPYAPPSEPSPVLPTASISHAGEDDFSIPGLPKRKLARTANPSGGGSHTALIIVVSVIATLLIGAGAVWILGLLPSQRRDTEVRDLMYRAEDAYRGHRYSHQADENDVEDITDAVLALAPQHARARELRSAAALGLRNQAVELANGGHPEQALPLLHRAVRLSDDPEIRTLLTQVDATVHNPTPPAPPTAVAPPTNGPPSTANTPHNATNRPPHGGRNPTSAQPPDNDPSPTNNTTPHPTFTPGHNGNVPTTPTFTPGPDPGATHTPPPVVHQPPAQPGPTNPPDNPPQMVGGPSQPDPTPPPPADPNAGGTAF